jgi:hypothetical protein
MPGLRDFLLFSLSLKNALHFVTAQNEPIQSLHTFGGVEWKSTTVKNIDDQSRLGENESWVGMADALCRAL